MTILIFYETFFQTVLLAFFNVTVAWSMSEGCLSNRWICNARRSEDDMPKVKPLTINDAFVKLNSYTGWAPCNRKYAENLVTELVEMRSAKKAMATFVSHQSTFPWQAFTIASLIVKCPLSTTPFAFELYGEIQTWGIHSLLSKCTGHCNGMIGLYRGVTQSLQPYCQRSKAANWMAIFLRLVYGLVKYSLYIG
jgi:hypothetical protein